MSQVGREVGPIIEWVAKWLGICWWSFPLSWFIHLLNTLPLPQNKCPFSIVSGPWLALVSLLNWPMSPCVLQFSHHCLDLACQQCKQDRSCVCVCVCVLLIYTTPPTLLLYRLTSAMYSGSLVWDGAILWHHKCVSSLMATPFNHPTSFVKDAMVSLPVWLERMAAVWLLEDVPRVEEIFLINIHTTLHIFATLSQDCFICTLSSTTTPHPTLIKRQSHN